MKRNLVLMTSVAIIVLITLTLVSAWPWSVTGKATTNSTNLWFGPNRLYEGKSTIITINDEKYTVNEKYTVSLQYISSDKVKLKVGDEISPLLSEGDTVSINGLDLKIKKISYANFIFLTNNYVTFMYKKSSENAKASNCSLEEKCVLYHYDKITLNPDGEESYLIRAKINYDSTDNRNETIIEKYDVNYNSTDNRNETSSNWITICEEKRIGDKCYIGNLIIFITDIVYTPDTETRKINFIVITSKKGIEVTSQDKGLAISSTNELTYIEKGNGTNYHKYFIASDDITKESHLLRARIIYDSTDNRNETNIEKYDGNSWFEICYNKYKGQECYIKNMGLVIDSIEYTSRGDEIVTLSIKYGSFNKLYPKDGAIAVIFS